ncbi:hypothetical protein EI42_04369 [Thermosporothrix hazakensis]|jgi:hypothetical protein|uniref:Uncharacterized protein n=1 Tax=Thermosporothrix hazakensis TaxID=644383 RepID=A0A326U3B5_THEHA|nr:hypothetical protein [Thermosporothrix hazakensis]PZW25317.1 hypothetical protein EI42_04369 [Thermosporothrix hazakensis]GCE50548.1 hypothetical protein KTH_54170 [Thermosporothrix hazakensis]
MKVVSLLGARSVFFVALFNSVFICLSLLYQPQTPTLATDLHTRFRPMVLRPIGCSCWSLVSPICGCRVPYEGSFAVYPEERNEK